MAKINPDFPSGSFSASDRETRSKVTWNQWKILCFLWFQSGCFCIIVVSVNQGSTEYGKKLFQSFICSFQSSGLLLPTSPQKVCKIIPEEWKENQHSVSKQQIYFFRSNSQNQILYQNNFLENTLKFRILSVCTFKAAISCLKSSS